jgi:signal transduction histidine kinase
MNSLRSRLGAGLVVSLVVMIALLWLMVGESVKLLLEQQMASRLAHDGEALLGGMQIESDGRVRLQQRRIPGIYQQPYSGHYFQVEAGGEAVRSRSLWDVMLPVPDVKSGETRIGYITGPRGQPLLLWARGYLKQGRVVRIAVAEDLLALKAGIAQFRWQLAAWSLAMVLILLLIQQYIVIRSLRPVAAAAADIERLEHGEISALPEQVPREVLPLVQAINKLLDRQRQRLHRSREALGNLAHTIKTPLTLLQQLLREKVAERDRATYEQLEDYTRQIDTRVNQSLRRARLAGDGLGAGRFDLRQDLPVLVDTLNRLHHERRITLHTRLGGFTQLPLEQQDGMELLGNLLDNAWKWAASTVSIALDGPEPLSLVVEDDGPGADAAALQSLTQRGARQDENLPGHGIGLSIVRSLVEEIGAEMILSTSPSLGGLQVTIRFATRA